MEHKAQDVDLVMNLIELALGQPEQDRGSRAALHVLQLVARHLGHEDRVGGCRRQLIERRDADVADQANVPTGTAEHRGK